MSELPLAPLERIMRNAGADRVSEDAVIALATILEDVAEEISEDAIAIAKHAGRKTIMADDIRLAKKA
ncbi:MAG: histone family protein [Candidatus Altiarchaeota archaeon]|nr:histone family protein [Candidatus Altiarchaeota archaeon]